jgi:hypothetical protein
MVKFDPSNIIVIEQLVEAIEKFERTSKGGTRFFCSEHPDEQIRFWCSDDTQYLCSECILEHQSHKL